MAKETRRIDMFDSAYRDRVRDAVWKTIIEVSTKKQI